MKTVINSYIMDISQLEKIVTTINYDRLMVFGNLTTTEDFNKIVRSEQDTTTLNSVVNRHSDIYYNGNSITQNLYPFEIFDRDIKSIVTITGNGISFIKNVSFSFYKNNIYKEAIISSWLTTLNEILSNYQETDNDNTCFLSLSVSYIIHENNNIDLLIIEGSINEKNDVRARSQLLNLLYKESEIKELDIRSILSKQLDYLSIPNYHYDEENVSAEISLSKSEYLSEEYIHDSIIKLENYINSINNIEMIGKSVYDKSIIYVYISLLYIFDTKKKILTNVKLLSITNPLSLKLIKNI